MPRTTADTIPGQPTPTQKRLSVPSATQIESWEKRLGGSAGLPEFIEAWNKQKFYTLGAIGGVAAAGAFAAFGPMAFTPWALGGTTAAYWYVGLNDIKQDRKAIRRNFPVLGNMRYIFESIRPEIYQYFVEPDDRGVPFNRQRRSQVYARAKDMSDTVPFGTTRDVYEIGHEWCNHSLFAKHLDPTNPNISRVTIGSEASGCKKPYSASLLNISAMSYGALSDNAVLALNHGAKLGGFYHNTGEGGVSKFHRQPGGDIVWNVGTGYFGCRTKSGEFCPDMFKETISIPSVKMVEIKLSQGAKPGHGGILPKGKITPDIAQARGVGMDTDCVSPPTHSAFDGPHGLMLFVQQLRELSGGAPIGFKLCVGQPHEAAAIVKAMVETGIVPDFITIDGAEGGTGAAPAEFSNSIGMPLKEGIHLIHNLLRGADLRHKIRLICSGKVLSGFDIVRTIALGADACNSARAMMFALGCIQALKCNSNKCPTGITTQDRELMNGLVVEDKALRVFRYHQQTIKSAVEIIGAVGLDDFSQLKPTHVMKRIGPAKVRDYEQQYPDIARGSLLDGTAEDIGPFSMNRVWQAGVDLYNNGHNNSAHSSFARTTTSAA